MPDISSRWLLRRPQGGSGMAMTIGAGRTLKELPPLSQQQLAFSERAQRIIPGGAHTCSKGDDQLPVNAPRAFVRGKGARVWDVDGREYVDWGMGMQSVLLGHAEETVDDAAVAALRNGQNFSRPSLLELETAEAVLELYPHMEMVKFNKNGSDANSAAIRLARAVTGRTLIAYDQCAPFLSGQDWFIGTTALDAGVPEEIRRLSVPFRYNDVESLERVFGEHPQQLAALIMEVTRDVKPLPGFLETVRRLCDEQGTLLILDEVLSGFRYGLHGAQALFGITPDLMTLGKGLANGYALAALLGKRVYMERGGLTHPQERLFLLSSTNGAEQSGLAAGRSTIRLFRRHPVIEHLAAVGQQLADGINQIATRHGIQHALFLRSDFACRPMLHTLDAEGRPSLAFRTLFLQETLRYGVFMPWICPSFRHGELELAQTFEAVDAAAAVYAKALEQRSVAGLLVGRAVKPVFRRYN